MLYFDKSALIHKKRTKRTSHKFRNSEKKHAFKNEEISVWLYLLSSDSSFDSLLLCTSIHTMCVHDPNYIDGIDENGNSTSLEKRKKRTFYVLSINLKRFSIVVLV